jgi:hypothetical protein
MKTSRKWNFKPIAGKIMVGLMLITLIGGITVEPALARNNHKSYNKHDNGRHRGHYKQARPVYRPYGYYGHRERVYYPPPPVVFVPPPPPGIGIFFPPIIIHP